MTPADIEAMAREAGIFHTIKADDPAEQDIADALNAAGLSCIARFADLVRARTLEDAALVCIRVDAARANRKADDCEWDALYEASAAIRALIPPPHPPGAPAVTAD